MQSYLLGCANIFFGYRTKEDFLESTEMVAIDDLPMVYRPQDPPFDPSVALDTIHDALKLAINVMKSARENNAVWRMQITKFGGIYVRPLSMSEIEAVNSRDHAGEPRIGLVPERLVNLMRLG